MKTYCFILSLVLLLGIPLAAFASPAYPGLIKKKQPDGTIVYLYLKGDEKVHWMETEDGYSLLYDKNQNIVYAVSDEKGNLIPSSVKAQDVSLRSAETESFLKKIPKKLNYSTTQVNTLKSIWNRTQKSSSETRVGLRAAVGEARAVCALISFPDKPLVKTREEFELLMNQTGYSASGAKGSVKDYYLENSYGNLDLTITVAGPYTVSKNGAYYGENDANGDDKAQRVQEFAMEAARLVFRDPAINPADYDNDLDGFIDAFHIIFAGYGEEAGADANSIWAHEYGFAPLTFGNKKLNVYSCSPELRGNSGNNITHIGVICHELGHIFGAPDFYDTDGTESNGQFEGTGKWDLMASGSWNNNGASPAHINMYQKIKFGWVNPFVLNQPQVITDMPNSVENAVAYRYNTATPGEYFVLENRQKIGFDQYVPGSGLLIYRVSVTNEDIFQNKVNASHPQKVYPICASAWTDPIETPFSYGSINTAGCPFPGSSNTTSFTDYTFPSAQSWNKTNTGKPLTEIQEQGKKISFRFAMSDVEPVTNLQITNEGQEVHFSWNKPSDEATAYNIYRNNQLLIKIVGKNNTSYTQSNVNPGSYNYCLTALYNNEESAPVCKEITVSDQTAIQVLNPETSAIYPNLLKKGEMLTIDLGYKVESILSFYTISGQLIRQETITDSVVRRKMDFNPGMYVLQIKTNSQTFIQKIIIQ